MMADKVRRCTGNLYDGTRCKNYIHHREEFCQTCAYSAFKCIGRDELGELCLEPVQMADSYCTSCEEKRERAWQARLDKYRKEFAEAKHRHPNACAKCLGRGGRYSGCVQELEAEWVDCTTCIEEDHCPWCGGPLMLDYPDENMHCDQNCGWHYEADLGTAVLPEPPEREE